MWIARKMCGNCYLLMSVDRGGEGSIKDNFMVNMGTLGYCSWVPLQYIMTAAA